MFYANTIPPKCRLYILNCILGSHTRTSHSGCSSRWDPRGPTPPSRTSPCHRARYRLLSESELIAQLQLSWEVEINCESCFYTFGSNFEEYFPLNSYKYDIINNFSVSQLLKCIVWILTEKKVYEKKVQWALQNECKIVIDKMNDILKQFSDLPFLQDSHSSGSDYAPVDFRWNWKVAISSSRNLTVQPWLTPWYLH